ncbi:MAG: hypothetical protein ACUVV4_02015 [Candidatus Bathyarchaeia archaeon]
MSPFDVIKTLKNLSARINHRIPKIYVESDNRIMNSGFIQKDQLVFTKSGAKFTRSDISLPNFKSLEKNRSFIEALRNIRKGELIL